jgi:hypothetical protein
VRRLLGWPATSVDYDFRLYLQDGLFTAVYFGDERVVLFTGTKPNLQEWLLKNYPKPSEEYRAEWAKLGANETPTPKRRVMAQTA